MTTHITIVSGFLGAGKTTLIRRLIGGVCAGERLAVIENEFGDAAIDGDVVRSGRLQVREIQSGCICCSLATDFLEALQALAAEYRPDRILIEPSGVARLSDIRAVVARAVSAGGGSLAAGGVITVADATRCAMYHEQFGTFYGDQLQSAETILLSRTDTALPGDVEAAEALIRRLNPRALLLTQPWDRLEPDALHAALLQVDAGRCGAVLRAKGVVFEPDGRALSFDYTPGRIDIRDVAPATAAPGRLCVIGTSLRREALAALFL